MRVNRIRAEHVKSMEKDSARLLDLARSGDVDAFAELFEGMRSTLFSVASRLVGPVEADDVVMETYLKSWQAIPRFSGRSSLKTWLYRIAHNCALDSIRSRQRRKEQSLPAGDPDAGPAREPVDDGVGPDEVAARMELVEEVRQALSMLSPDHAVALQLRYTDGLTYAEIAAATGVSLGTVMSRLFNAKRRLRTIVEQR